jgi:two-component system phosphate regulon response regulator OmpR
MHQAADRPAPAGEVTPKPRVLVIDDDERVRSVLARLLRHNGMEAGTAVDGGRALERLREGEAFDCIIVDLLMPRVCGREFVEALREENLFPLERVIVLTAVHNADNATAYLRYGCGAYCGKPWENQRLLEIIHSITRGENGGQLRAIV